MNKKNFVKTAQIAFIIQLKDIIFRTEIFRLSLSISLSKYSKYYLIGT